MEQLKMNSLDQKGKNRTSEPKKEIRDHSLLFNKKNLTCFFFHRGGVVDGQPTNPTEGCKSLQHWNDDMFVF
jgi:hypothetical protein